jgi:hypothetical protein
VFRFTGTVAGDSMSGTLDMGGMGAKWTAKRPVRPPAGAEGKSL